MQRCFLFAPLCGAQAISAGGARCDSPGLAHGWEARAALRERRRPGPMRRPTGAAGALLAPCRAHQEGLPKVWAEICSQPNQSAISGSFFGTKYWKCAESDDGNPKKSMILHRMVPSVSAKSVLLDLSLPPPPKQRVLAPLRDAGGAAGGRRPRPESGVRHRC